MFNTKHLFIGPLILTNEYSIVTVDRSDHRLTHYGLVEVTVWDNTDKIWKISIEKALYF